MTIAVRIRPPREVTREAILKAAESRFRRSGFQATSLEEIAGAADLTKGAVYSSFKGKDELMLAVLERHVMHNIERYRAEAASSGSRNAIDALAAFLAERAIDDAAWSTCFAEFALHASRRPSVAKKLAAVRGKLRAEIIELIRPIVDNGRATPERLESAATIFSAIGNGLTLERMSDPSRVNVEIYRDALKRLLGK